MTGTDAAVPSAATSTHADSGVRACGRHTTTGPWACRAAHRTARSACSDPSTPTTIVPGGICVLTPSDSSGARAPTSDLGPEAVGPSALPDNPSPPEDRPMPTLSVLTAHECERLLR